MDKRIVADPAEDSNHNRGCAVDLSLYVLATGEEVTMPAAMTKCANDPYADFPAVQADERLAAPCCAVP